MLLLQFSGLSKAHGIEGIYILAGKVINQDGGLGHAFITPGAEGVRHCAMSPFSSCSSP